MTRSDLKRLRDALDTVGSLMRHLRIYAELEVRVFRGEQEIEREKAPNSARLIADAVQNDTAIAVFLDSRPALMVESFGYRLVLPLKEE